MVIWTRLFPGDAKLSRVLQQSVKIVLEDLATRPKQSKIDRLLVN